MTISRSNIRAIIVFVTGVFVSTTSYGRLAELLITDGSVKKPVTLVEAKVIPEISDSTARVTYELTFISKKQQELEGTFYFALPSNSYVHEFGMWINGSYQRSAIVEAKAGRVAYESIVRRGVDPGLLEWSAGNNFKMRVYPIVPNKPTKIRLVVGLPATTSRQQLSYEIPLDLGMVKKFSVDIKGAVTSPSAPKVFGLKNLTIKKTDSDDGVVKFQGSYSKRNTLPPDTIRITAVDGARGEVVVRRENADDKRFFEARVYPKLPSKKRPKPKSALVYWDFSLSEEDTHDEKISVLESYLKARKPGPVYIYGFNQKVFKFNGQFRSSDFNSIKKALRRPYDGATRMDLVADHMKKQTTVAKDSTDLLLFTNAVDTFEMFDFDRIKNFANKKVHAFIVTPLMGGNTALVNRFSRALNATVVSQDEDVIDATFLNYPWTISSVKGTKNVKDLLSPSAPVFPGDGVVLRGRVKKDGKAQLKMSFNRGSEKKTMKYSFDTSDLEEGDTGTIPRLWAMEKISRLIPEKRNHTSEIKNLSLVHQLMSPFTVMVVLEFCEDYTEFKIDSPDDCKSRPQRTVVDYSYDEESDDEEADYAMDAQEGSARDLIAAPSSSSPPNFDAKISDPVTISPAPVASYDAAAEGGGEYDDEDLADDYGYSEYDGGNSEPPARDTTPQDYGFEKTLLSKKSSGAIKLYSKYLAIREPYKKVPFYYIYTAGLLMDLKRFDLAELVLSNIVEVRPGDARWLRIYAYNLISWGHPKDTIAIYRAISELREEDPQSFRDFGLAMEAMNEPVGAMKLYAKVYTGKWDSRHRGIIDIVRRDLSRTAQKVLQLRNITAKSKSLAKKYATADKSRNDRLVITASWDTDNTDVDLHVVEPAGVHVFYSNREPAETHGKLSYDSTQGFGPEQYRNPKPFRGQYRVYLKYYSQNPAVVRDGSFVRVDFKVVENGKTKRFTKTLFLKDPNEVRTVLTFSYNDRSSKAPPANFKDVLNKSRVDLKAKRFTKVKNDLVKIGTQKRKRDEAKRFFNLARAMGGLKQYAKAEEYNQRAYALDNTMLSAIYNNACYSSLAKNRAKSIHYLNMLADAIGSNHTKMNRYNTLMRRDPDLINIRATQQYKTVHARFKLAH